MPTIHPGGRPLLHALAAGALLLGAGACSKDGQHEVLATTRPDVGASAASQPLATRELLELAFRSAQAIPADPHHKTRARVMYSVTSACLELGQPQLAQQYAERIDNWRKGQAFADLAWHCALQGDARAAAQHLERAQVVAETVLRAGDEQEWRRERVRARMAGAMALLGKLEAAASLEAGVADSEWGAVALARAHRADAAGRAELAAEMAAVVQIGVFDRTRGALQVLAVLFDRGYADATQRDVLREQITKACSNLPPNVRLDMLATLVRHALAHGDRAEALRLLNAAAPLTSTGAWTPDLEVAWRARLAALRHRAGEPAVARTELERALTRFETERLRIADIDHADALRPCAEAWHVLGDRAATLTAYAAALRAGLHNPNSRPRAEDLAAICLSLAVHGVEPDAGLLQSLQAACDGLDHPW